MASEQFCLKWNDHKGVLTNNVGRLLQQKSFVDCTLAAEGQYIGAHKVILSACSPYFEELLSHHTEKHPIFILKDIKFEEVKAIMSYMYHGEVIVPYDKLAELLRAAESLQVKGLGEKNYNKSSELNGSPQQQLQQQQLQQQKTPMRPVGQTTSRVRSGGSGDRRVSQPNAEIVDLTDEPQKYAKTNKAEVVQRISPYIPKKYARKLDYQTASQQVIQRKDSVSISDPNATAVFVPQNPGLTVRTSMSGPSISVSQPVTAGPSNLQQMSSYVPSGPYASNVSPTISRQRPHAQQGSVYQQITLSHGPVTASSTQNIVHQRKSPTVISGAPNRAPIVAQHVQAIPNQLPVSSENELSLGQLLSTQSSQQQLPSVQKIHLPVQAPKMQLTSVLSSQSQSTPEKPSQAQIPSVHSPQSQSLQIEPPHVQSPSDLPLVQGTSDTQSTTDTVSESQEKISPSLESNMLVEDPPQSSEFEGLNESAQSQEEERNEPLDTPEEGDEGSTTITDEQNIKKARRGRPIGGDRPFKCPECGKLFTQKSNMEKHRRIHSGECLKCDICDKSFVGRSTLIRHLRTHNTKNSHKCHICGMMFSSTKILEDHLTQHASTSSSDQ